MVEEIEVELPLRLRTEFDELVKQDGCKFDDYSDKKKSSAVLGSSSYWTTKAAMNKV